MTELARQRRPWIRMRPDLHRDPDVVRIARAIEKAGILPAGLSRTISIDVVVSRLLQMWGRFNTDADNGVLLGYDLKQIDELVQLDGWGKTLVELRWLEAVEGGIRVHDPRDYIGSMKRDRDIWRSQKQLQRASKAEGSSSGPNDSPIAVLADITEDGSAPSEQHNERTLRGGPAGPSASASASVSDSDEPSPVRKFGSRPAQLSWMSDSRLNTEIQRLLDHARSSRVLGSLAEESLVRGAIECLVVSVGDRATDADLPEDDRQQQQRMRRDHTFTDAARPGMDWMDDLARRAKGKPLSYLCAAFEGGPRASMEVRHG